MSFPSNPGENANRREIAGEYLEMFEKWIENPEILKNYEPGIGKLEKKMRLISTPSSEHPVETGQNREEKSEKKLPKYRKFQFGSIKSRKILQKPPENRQQSVRGGSDC